MKKHTGVVYEKTIGVDGFKRKAYVLSSGGKNYTLRYAGRNPYLQDENLPNLLGKVVEFNGQIYGCFLFIKSWSDYRVIDREFNLGF